MLRWWRLRTKLECASGRDHRRTPCIQENPALFRLSKRNPSRGVVMCVLLGDCSQEEWRHIDEHRAGVTLVPGTIGRHCP